MNTGWLRSGSGDAGVMVNGPVPGMLKLTVSVPGLALALAIAWRSEPIPLSLVLVTTNALATAATLAANCEVLSAGEVAVAVTT